MECSSVYLLLCALLILNVIGIEGRVKRQSSDLNPEPIKFGGDDNESFHKGLTLKWGKKPGGWQKGVPSCGKPGQPPCQNESNSKPGSTDKPGQTVTPGSNGNPGSSGKPDQTSAPNTPKPTESSGSQNTRPTFATTIAPEEKPKPTPPNQGPIGNQKPTLAPTQGPNGSQKPTPPPTQGPNGSQKPTQPPTQGPNESQRPTPPPTQGPNDNQNDELDPAKEENNGAQDKHEIDRCMRKCLMTAEDEPVCGNNGVTYINPWHFKCAQNCKIAVTTFTRGACPPKCDSNGSSSATIKQCISKCPVTSEHDPVCGTNGVTYDNYGRLLCAKQCGVAVDLRAKGPCRSSTESPVTGTADEETTPSTPSSDAIRQCMGRCPVTSEYNPVCGSDGVTYTNHGRLICAKDCGANVVMLSKGTCRPTPPSTEITIIRTTPPDALTIACMSRCPSTPEYNPVCGTDLVTYTNPGKLYCAQSCGSDVTVLRRGPCQENVSRDPPVSDQKDPVTPVVVVTPSNPVTPNTSPSSVARACMEKCPSTNEYNPVCGTDYVTYNNAGKLFCAQSCGINVKELRHGKCPAQPTTLATTTATSTTAGSSTTQSAADCVNRCPKTPEYNPVCGTDFVTYKNPSHLNCAQTCGASVTMLRYGQCPKTPVTTTSTEPMTTGAWRWE